MKVDREAVARAAYEAAAEEVVRQDIMALPDWDDLMQSERNDFIREMDGALRVVSAISEGEEAA